MSNAKDIEFFVERAVLDIGVKIIFAVVEEINNSNIHSEWTENRMERIRTLLHEHRDIDYSSGPVLEGFHAFHDRSSVRCRKNIPVSENLIFLLKKNKDVFPINPTVDIYNIISMEIKLALGAHYIDRVTGNVTLRFTDGTESFVPIGQKQSVPVNAHEYCYCDDTNEALCRLDVRQIQKTRVDERTHDIFISFRAMMQPMTVTCRNGTKDHQ